MSELIRTGSLGMRYGDKAVLSEVTLGFAQGGLVAVAGPNGAGKSTLLGILAGLREGYNGECSYRGREVRRWNRAAFARRVSFVPQSLSLQFPFTAEQVVLMGRTPYGDGLFESPRDRAQVERAMELTDVIEFRSRDFRSLSGGERQRVVLASALAQEPETLLLDEPTSFLDLSHQVSMYRLLRDLCGQELLAIVVTHDLNLAASYCDRLVMLRAGKVVADGQPGGVLTSGTLAEVFDVEAEVRDGRHGRPWILYGD